MVTDISCFFIYFRYTKITTGRKTEVISKEKQDIIKLLNDGKLVKKVEQKLQKNEKKN